MLFISKDNNLNKAHIKYLENHLYILAKESKRYEIVNSNVPTEASISEFTYYKIVLESRRVVNQFQKVLRF